MNSIFSYLSELEQNNNREWYAAQKKAYKLANDEFLDFLKDLMIEIGKFDASVLPHEPKDLTFKLVRDTRFSKDKSPYNPTFRAHISSQGKLPIPVGYFIVIKPGNQSFIGGGLFADMFKDATDKVRAYISKHGEEWEQIITNPTFQKNFQVKGNALKKVPADYDKDLPQAEYLKYKSWFIEYPISDKELLEKDSIVRIAELCKIMKPLNDYLNKALEGFVMPQR